MRSAGATAASEASALSKRSVAEAASNCSAPEGERVELSALYRLMHHDGVADIASQEDAATAHPPPPACGLPAARPLWRRPAHG